MNLQKTQDLLKETYRICTIYHDKETVPKEMCKLFTNIRTLLEYVLMVYGIDELSTSSDSAVYDAIGFIIDEIEYGFYNGKYEQAFPNLQVDDSKGNSHVLNMENDFLEFLIDANR